MIDSDRLKQLLAEIGQEDLHEIIALFLHETEQSISQLHRANDPASFRHQMHVLKGCAMNLGLDAFADLCATAEGGTTTGADGHTLHQLHQCYRQSRSALMMWRDTNLA